MSLVHRICLVFVSGLAAGPWLAIEAADDVVAETSPAFRAMMIQVQDEQGEPLPGTRIHVNVLASDGKKTTNRRTSYETGDDGRIEIKLPSSFFNLQVWTSRPHYVHMYAGFQHETQGVNLGNKDIAAAVPDSFQFALGRGTKLSGTVVDEDGSPIAGVKVDVETREIKSSDGKSASTTNPTPRPMDPFGTIVTDQNGYWSVDEVRPKTPNIEYHVRLKHPDYIGDAGYSRLQQEQKITSEMLMEDDAKIVMKRGARIAGIVVDSAGQPVTRGIVHLGENSAFGSSSHSVRLNEQGEFVSTTVPPDDYPLTVIAAGFLPERRVVHASISAEKHRFTLKPGKRIVIRTVDAEGHPVPAARVQITKWGRIESLPNASNAEGLDSGIPMRSDENGLFVWDGAPDEAITYSISARVDSEFRMNMVVLVPRAEEHVVALRPLLKISGSVTDAVTGKPIEAFSVVPVAVFRPKWLSTFYGNSSVHRDGHYEIENLVASEIGRRYHVRIEAEGYRTAMSDDSYGVFEGHLSVDFSLTPARSMVGRVINAAGKSVAGATVILGTPTTAPRINDGVLSESPKWPTLTTDAFGRFKMAASFEPAYLRVIHETGVADVLRQGDEPPGTITLQPWAKVSGTLLWDGKPVADEWITIQPAKQPKLGEPRFQEGESVKTDLYGRFEFPRLNPDAVSLSNRLGSRFATSQSISMVLMPGEKRVVSLGNKGTRVTGKLFQNGRGDDKIAQHCLLYLIRRDSGVDRPSGQTAFGLNPKTPFQLSWYQDERFHDWLIAQEFYETGLSPAGNFEIGGVAVGEYDLVFSCHTQPEGCAWEHNVRHVTPVRVTESEASSGTKDLGQIEAEYRTGPRLGQSLSDLKICDVNGKQKTLREFHGRHILLHIWGRWTASDMEAIADVQAAVAKSSDDRLVYVGLNVDADAAAANAFVARQNWTESQSVVGVGSDIERQLVISSVPTYYLIGRDGSLISSTREWAVMVQAINALEK
ncbi:carboxypeptidase regulatory-like domain-containing protein [Schlesneria paludicola]|uniref:carboxypeptidase regulatory-like domain-containing protein n=1 Tax=Schlesneria paludicola TaxID=360056 RepID=UPI0012FBA206|nr:carboxypeptidase regulatory-like domain-containing protein [Schlesneria paludicola]